MGGRGGRGMRWEVEGEKGETGRGEMGWEVERGKVRLGEEGWNKR